MAQITLSRNDVLGKLFDLLSTALGASNFANAATICTKIATVYKRSTGEPFIVYDDVTNTIVSWK